jgi:hypothetical protein
MNEFRPEYSVAIKPCGPTQPRQDFFQLTDTRRDESITISRSGGGADDDRRQGRTIRLSPGEQPFSRSVFQER